jgi:hypothetical protein
VVVWGLKWEMLKGKAHDVWWFWYLQFGGRIVGEGQGDDGGIQYITNEQSRGDVLSIE